ncbi:hypothetical protein IQ06DRAFT_230184 [Phaeosphaeriaceae sp. SRC1lsM3a]|nr:hypothetical protein IQ06DRAFT_230184 [Stagonospora sp. SRC1lsM3a]
MTPDSKGYVPVTACNAQWSYSPSEPAALALSVLFGLLTLAHLILAIIFRKRFCWVIVMASAWETAAFVLRALGARNQQNQTLAIASQLFFLLAPLWINAFVYMTAGRLIYMLHPDKKIWGFKAMSLGKWFVWLDVFSFIVQGTGGSMLNPGNDANTQDAGKKIYMGGVGVQEAFILLFLGLIVKFHIDALRLDRQGLLVGTGMSRRAGMWKWVTYSLYAVLLLITMRIIFRLAEFSGGMEPEHNKLPFEEGYALGLDAVPMLLAIFILAAIHPGLVLKGEGSEFPSRKVRKAEKKAIKAEKKEAKRMKKEGKSNVEMNVMYTGTRESGDGLIHGGRHA